MKLKLESIIKSFKNYYVNPNLTSKKFPIPKTIRTEGVKIIYLDKRLTSEEVLEKIKQEGCSPGNIYELAEWLKNNPNKINISKWYVALGQTWEEADGDHRVPRVGARSDGGFYWLLGYFERDWRDDSAFFCFCDKNLETKALKNPLDSLTLKNAIKIVKEGGFKVII